MGHQPQAMPGCNTTVLLLTARCMLIQSPEQTGEKNLALAVNFKGILKHTVSIQEHTYA